MRNKKHKEIELTDIEKAKILNIAIRNHIDLVKYLYDNHRSILREYEKTRGNLQIHFAGEKNNHNEKTSDMGVLIDKPQESRKDVGTVMTLGENIPVDLCKHCGKTLDEHYRSKWLDRDYYDCTPLNDETNKNQFEPQEVENE